MASDAPDWADKIARQLVHCIPSEQGRDDEEHRRMLHNLAVILRLYCRPRFDDAD